MNDHTIVVINSLRPLLYSSVYSCDLFLISSASVRSLSLLSFTVPTLARNVPLVSPIVLKRSLARCSRGNLFLGSFRLFAEFCSRWLQDSGPPFTCWLQAGGLLEVSESCVYSLDIGLLQSHKAEMSPCHFSNLPLCGFSPIFLFHISLTDFSASLFCF